MILSSSNLCNNNNNCISNACSVLIVDDDIDTLSVVRRLLREYAFNTCCFTKPAIALEHYKTNPRAHHLVISDLQMPTMNGFEFIRKVKEINSNTKVFLMTANFQTGDNPESLLSNDSGSIKSTIDEFILKPFSIEQLIISIRKHIGQCCSQKYFHNVC
jgi:CheY-like chemotaxis protein